MATRDTTADLNLLGLQLGLVRAELVRAIEQALKERGLPLRFSQFRVLIRLFTLGSMGAGELARSLCYDAGAMTRLLDRLETQGYLIRVPDQDDRRALRIELTATGKAMGQLLRDCADQVLEMAQATLTRDERANLQDYLQRMLVALGQDQLNQQVTSDAT